MPFFKTLLITILLFLTTIVESKSHASSRSIIIHLSYSECAPTLRFSRRERWGESGTTGFPKPNCRNKTSIYYKLNSNDAISPKSITEPGQPSPALCPEGSEGLDFFGYFLGQCQKVTDKKSNKINFISNRNNFIPLSNHQIKILHPTGESAHSHTGTFLSLPFSFHFTSTRTFRRQGFSQKLH
jgi:hypothetical protein